MKFEYLLIIRPKRTDENHSKHLLKEKPITRKTRNETQNVKAIIFVAANEKNK